MRQIQIDPCDVLFFRDCRPFSAGEQSVAAARFPPLPLPFVGALRRVMLGNLGRKKGLSLDEMLNDPETLSMVGGPDDPAPLSFSGPFLVREKDQEQQLFLPCPSDVLQVKHRNKVGTVCSLLAPEKEPLLPGVSVSEPGLILRAGEINGQAEASQGLLFSSEILASYLCGEMEENLDEGAISSSEFFQKEQRTGIALEPGKRTTQQGMLYSADFVRLNNKQASRERFSFVMQVNTRDGLDIPLPEQGTLRLGGEGKFAFFRDLPDEGLFADIKNAAEDVKDQIQDTQKFKLCLLAPAVFRNGWIPDSVNRNDLSLQFNGRKFRLKGASVPKAVNISGWDLKNKRPRDLYKAVPAGSVYFFEADEEVSEETAQAVMDAFFLKSAMSRPESSGWIPPLYRASGFGLSVVGSWDYQQSTTGF